MLYKTSMEDLAMEVRKILKHEQELLDCVTSWSHNWWGKPDGLEYENVRYMMEHSLGEDRLPQTIVALEDGAPVGMYQISMADDLRSRPDIYPWLANVYVDKPYRGRGICGKLMESVPHFAKQAGIETLYLYTHHVGLYEKYGWEFVELVPTFKKDSPMERLYKLKIGE